MAKALDIAVEMDRIFKGAVVTRIERRNDFIRWYFMRDDGIEIYQEWHDSLTTVPRKDWK